ncbi:putative orphan protein [Pseudoalteromonas translucida]|uniref:Orphan protein n=1 Tax=Pseudoalteromonas translucida (strain TAC 125) TaxID=326442 RepID=Q3IFE8_PSET1|nr:putative orphan protein [Pseudoalteromonas translucida]
MFNIALSFSLELASNSSNISALTPQLKPTRLIISVLNHFF